MWSERVAVATLHTPKYPFPDFSDPTRELLAKPLEKITTGFQGVRDGLMRGVNRFWNRNLFNNLDRALTPELQQTISTHYLRNTSVDAAGITRVSEESQSILLAIQGIESQISTARNSTNLLSRSERTRLQNLVDRLNRAGRDLSPESRTERVISRLGLLLDTARGLDIQAEQVIPTPLSLVDQPTGADRFGIPQGVKDWWGDRMEDLKHRLDPPTSGSGPTPPSRPPRRPKLSVKAQRIIAITTPLIVLGTIGGVIGYDAYKKNETGIKTFLSDPLKFMDRVTHGESESSEKPTITAADMGFVPIRPGNMDKNDADAWEKQINGNKPLAYTPKEKIDLSVLGKAQSLAVDDVLSNTGIYNAILKTPNLPDSVRRGVLDMRAEDGTRKRFNYDSPDHQAVREFLTIGANMDDKASNKDKRLKGFDREYDYAIQKRVEQIVDDTEETANITTEAEPNNPIVSISDGTGKFDFVYRAKLGKPMIVRPSVIDPKDSEYTPLPK